MERQEYWDALIPVEQHHGPQTNTPPPYTIDALTDSLPPPGATNVTNDGRINIDLDSRLAKTLVRLVPSEDNDSAPQPSRRLTVHKLWTIRLNIVIQVVGSRGDVQPFVALGQALRTYGHRVRLATHDCFEGFVRDAGLEFWPIGGDPKELMAYMVRNPGLIPSMKSLREGDVQRKQKMVAEILAGCWKSCIEPDLHSGQPFVAEAIIANPPSFAHVHCAQALGVPLHIMFTMPWSSTRAFPHPLANFKGGEIKTSLVNYASYGVVEWLTWQGLGDVINEFRASIDLEEVPASVGPVLTAALKIPFTYCWSPALIPKPVDWPAHIDVCGFFFREPPPYSPPADIDRFLKAGPRPVYIGFGSIVIGDPAKMTQIVLDAVRKLGVRAIISRGWSNLGEGLPAETEDVLFIGDCPHEWLFQKVSVVVHHGGAGTAACGLRNACPTVVVPFFGDQPFWGNMIAAAGAGPKPIPYKLVTTENLSAAISHCLTPSATTAAQNLSSQMDNERGVEAAVQSFHANLPTDGQCALLPNSLASWTYKTASLRLSKRAAQILLDQGLITENDLETYEIAPIRILNNRWDPITGTGSASFGVVSDITSAAKTMIVDPFTELKRSSSAPTTRAVVAGRMVSTSAKGFCDFNVAMFKGMLVDIPLATAEGFRNAPKLYGEEPMRHGEVTGIVSGFQVGARTFAHGMADGFADPFRQPYALGKTEGALGVAKGVGKGLAGFMCKTSAATVGIMAYPADGISKSLRHWAKSGTRKRVKMMKLVEGEYEARRGVVEGEIEGVVRGFVKVGKGKARTWSGW